LGLDEVWDKVPARNDLKGPVFDQRLYRDLDHFDRCHDQHREGAQGVAAADVDDAGPVRRLE